MVFLIRDVMRREFLAMPPDRTVLSCVEEMVRRREGFALLTEEGRVTGIVTEWDLLEKVLALGKDPRLVRVSEIATRPVRQVPASAGTMEVIEEMVRSGIRRMVVTEAGQAVGVVAAKDVFRAFPAYVDKVSADIARLHSSTP